MEAIVDEAKEGGAVRGCEKSVRIVRLETGGGDERASGEIRVGEEEEHVLVHGKVGSESADRTTVTLAWDSSITTATTTTTGMSTTTSARTVLRALQRVSRLHAQPAYIRIARQSTSATVSESVLPTAARPSASRSPLQRYDSLVFTGALRPDPHQRRIIEHLQSFYTQLLAYTPTPTPPSATFSSSSSLFSRLFSRELPEPESVPPNVPKGLYLYGDVGTGKTMLMDLFFDALPSSLTRKRRVHFHAFMIDVHKRVHAAKIAMGLIGGGGGASVGGGDGGDPIAPVARDLAREAHVLCFDEFQVTDIVDAMILRRLLEGLLKYGVVCVITSKLVSNYLPRRLSSFAFPVDIPMNCTRTGFSAPASYLP